MATCEGTFVTRCRRCALIVAAWSTVFTGLLAGSSRAERVENVRQLLRQYRAETLAQVFPEGPGALLALAQLQPSSELTFLLENRDSSVLELRGPFFAEVCRRTKTDCIAPLLSASKEKEAEWRAFACAALGSLGDETAVAPLLERLSDDNAVQSAHGQPSVAVFAAMALLEFRRCEGVGELLAFAERAEYWQEMFLEELQELSGEHFGADVKSWSAWFEAHRPECVRRRSRAPAVGIERPSP